MTQKSKFMIDWSKERTDKNYCGYCTIPPSGSFCDGSCFSKNENKVKHVLDMLNLIPNQIEELKKKQQDYIDCLSVS